MDAAPRRRIDDRYAEACARLERVSPTAAQAEAADGAALIDIRTPDNRARDGIVPGSFHIPRTVLEWRVDIDSQWRNPHLGGLDQRLIVLCDHGYCSVFAALDLRELGFARATDLDGGFLAWRDAGLPVAPAPRERPAGVLEGAWPAD